MIPRRAIIGWLVFRCWVARVLWFGTSFSLYRPYSSRNGEFTGWVEFYSFAQDGNTYLPKNSLPSLMVTSTFPISPIPNLWFIRVLPQVCWYNDDLRSPYAPRIIHLLRCTHLPFYCFDIPLTLKLAMIAIISPWAGIWSGSICAGCCRWENWRW